MSSSDTLDALLLRDGAVTPAQASHARILHAQQGGFLGDQFIALGYLDQATLVRSIARQLGLGIASDDDVIIAPRRLASLVSPAWVRQWRVVPFLEDEDALHVAMYDPAGRHALPQLQGQSQKPVRMFVASEPVVESTIARLYPSLAQRPTPLPQPLMSEIPRAVTMGMPAVQGPPPGRSVPRQVTMLNMPAVGAPPSLPAVLGTSLQQTIEQAFPAVQTSPEIPNDNFTEALKLQDVAGPSPEPELLFRKKPTPTPILLTRKKEPVKRIGTVGEAAELMFSVENVTRMGEVAVGYLVNLFPRALCLEVREEPAPVLASHGLKMEPVALALAGLPSLQDLLQTASTFYGPAQALPDMAALHTMLGGDPPSSLLILPVPRNGGRGLLLYADAPSHERYDDIRDMETLAREMGMALDALDL